MSWGTNPCSAQKALSHFLGSLAPSWTLCIVKIHWKWPRRQNFDLPYWITWPPGGQSKKLTNPAVGLVPKIIPAKFRPNLSSFGTTFRAETDERRVTPQQSKGRFTTMDGGLRPLGGSLRDLSSLPKPPWKREPLSLIQAAAFLKKEGKQDRQQPGTEIETDCPSVSFMELFLQSTANYVGSKYN